MGPFLSPSLCSGVRVEKQIQDILKHLGEDPDREGLLRTPKRYLTALERLTRGYTESAEQIIKSAIYEIPEVLSSEMVLVRDIELYSLCEHHLLPFFGKCHVAYLPKGRIVGLSKVARLVDVYAKRLQVQERLTCQIAQALMEHLNPAGVGVVIEASHLCMMMRGVEKQNATARTCSLMGNFEKQEVRAEFLQLIR